MTADEHIWQIWARNIHRWGLADFVAALLESGGALMILAAQAVYLGQPLLAGFLPEAHLQALARLLEEPEQTRAFSDYLRLESSP